MFHKTDTAQKHSFSILDRGKNLQLRSQLLLGCLLSLDAQLSQLLPPLIGNLGLLFPLLLKFLKGQNKGQSVRYKDTQYDKFKCKKNRRNTQFMQALQ